MCWNTQCNVLLGREKGKSKGEGENMGAGEQVCPGEQVCLTLNRNQTRTQASRVGFFDVVLKHGRETLFDWGAKPASKLARLGSGTFTMQTQVPYHAVDALDKCTKPTYSITSSCWYCFHDFWWWFVFYHKGRLPAIPFTEMVTP
ncbi:unnamed protein product [Discosporangium mesarthrocarpum]